MSSMSVRPNRLGLKVNRSLTLCTPRPAPLRASRARSLSVYALERSQVETRVVEIIGEQLATDQGVSLESEFVALGADSLDIVEIMMALEAEFDMQFDTDKTSQIESVKGVVDYIIQVSEAKPDEAKPAEEA